MKIETEPKTLQVLLSEAFYVIPRYQRPYSWDSANLDDFWDDLTALDADNYFIGPMVFYRGSKKVIEPTCEVVDGQQRLTSAFLLLAAIRDKLSEIGENPLSERVHTYLERQDRNAKLQNVLNVEQEFPFFQSIISKKTVDISTILDDEAEGKLVRDAYSYFKTRISKTQKAVEDDSSVPPKKKSEILKKKLTEIRDRLLSLLVNAIYLDNEDDAYVVFETLNTRGKDLEIIDLVKTLIMRTKREANANLDLLKEEWKQFVARLGGARRRQNHNQLIYHSWISRKPYVSQKKSFSTIKKSIGQAQVDDYWNELREDAKIFARIQSPNRAMWVKPALPVARSLAALAIFGVTQPTPLLISLIRAHDQAKITLKTLKSALRVIECFHFGLTALTGKSSSGGISGMYAALARRLHQASNGGETSQALTELKEKLGERTPKLDVFSSSFVDLQYGTDLRTNERLVKYVLAELDYYYRKDDGIDYSLWTVEHICPQSDKGCAKRFDIGNLILVSSATNGKLGTESFTKKRGMLEKAGHYLDDAIKSAKTWGDNEIASRSKLLAEQAHGFVWAVK